MALPKKFTLFNHLILITKNNIMNTNQEGWADDVTNHNLRHYYKDGHSLCGKATEKPYMRRFDTESSGDKYAKDCSICIKKLKSLKIMKPNISTTPSIVGEELKCTPGNWLYDDGHLYTGEKDRKYTTIAHIYDIYNNEGEAEVNWPLILASKDMYRALKEVIDNWHSNSRNFNKKEPAYIKSVRKALSKAIGK